jgi:hypothetical protein
MPSGQSTGYADRIFDHFQAVGLGDFLTNLADVQPDKVLQFIQTFIETHDVEIPEVTFEEVWRGYSSNPIRELPSILQTLAADARYIGQALDRLWLLGRNDKGPSYRFPGHPMRILEDIAEVRADKDARIYDEILRAVDRWSQTPDAFSHRFTPLDILDKLMDREPILSPNGWTQDNALEQEVSAVNLKDFRRRGIRILAELARRSNPVVQHRALSSLLTAIWSPEELLVGGAESEVREQENHLISETIQEILGTSKSGLLAYTVELKIRPMRPDCDVERNQALCDLLALVPVDLDSRLMRYLRFGRVQRAFFQDEARQGIIQLNEAVSRDLAAVIEHMVDHHRDASAIKARLERDLNEIAQYGAESNPDELLQALATEHPLIATAIGELVVADPESHLAPQLDHLLVPLRAIDGVAYRRITEAALAVANLDLQMSISHALSRVEPLEPWERAVIKSMTEGQTAEFVPQIIRSIGRFPRDARDEAMAVIRAIDIGSDPDLAEELVGVVVGYPRTITKPIPDDVRDTLLPKLVPVTRVADEGRATHDLLDRLAIQDPEQVVQFFLDRIRHGTELRREGDHDYAMVPTIRLSRGFDLDSADSQARHRTLTRIANAMVSPPEGVDPYYLDDLYALMANGFDALSIQVLEEFVAREGRHGVRPALHLLRRAPNRVVFDRVEFVGHLLEVAGQAGPEELANVHASLFSIARNMPEIVPGEPWPDPIVSARKQAGQAAAKQPEASLLRDFYEALARESDVLMN